MKASELRKLIREEVRKVLNEEKTSVKPNEIKDTLKRNKTGIYVFGGDQEAVIAMEEYNKLIPLFYTDNLVTNKSNLIKTMEAKYPKYEEFTVVDIDQDGNRDVVTF